MEKNINSWSVGKWATYTLIFGGIVTILHVLHYILGPNTPYFISIAFKYINLIIIIPTTILLSKLALSWELSSYSWIWDSITYFVFFGILFLPILTRKLKSRIVFSIISLIFLATFIICAMHTIVEWGL